MHIPSQSLTTSSWAQQIPSPPAADAQRILQNTLAGSNSPGAQRTPLVDDSEDGLTHELTSGPSDELRDVFREFVGKTLFGQMLASMRDSVDKPAYFHGGQTEEIFQQQLDQVLVEEITEASADQIADPMLELFHQPRR